MHTLFSPQSSSSYSVPPEPFNFDVVSRSDYGRKSFSKRLKKKIDNFLNSEVVVVSGLGRLHSFRNEACK